MNKKRFKLRDLLVDRVDLVDRGANQYADIVIAKNKDEGYEDDDEMAEDTQTKNGPRHLSEFKRKKKKKGSAFPERNAAESSSGGVPEGVEKMYAEWVEKAFPPKKDAKRPTGDEDDEDTPDSRPAKKPERPPSGKSSGDEGLGMPGPKLGPGSAPGKRPVVAPDEDEAPKGRARKPMDDKKKKLAEKMKGKDKPPSIPPA